MQRDRRKGELVWDELIPWLIGLGLLVLAIFVYIIFSGKGQEYLQFLKQMLRLRP